MFTRHSVFAWMWTAVVSLLCGLPGYSFPDLSIWAVISFDGAAHAFVFVVFSFLWTVALYKSRSRIALRYGVWPGLCGSVAYGIFIELMQYLIFVRRAAEWTDMLADGIGAVAGIMVFYLVFGDTIKKIRAQVDNGVNPPGYL